MSHTILFMMISDATDIYIVADGVRIAKRGHPGSAQARTWISLEPGWRVLDGKNGAIVTEYTPVNTQ